jgi:hypothetical protein
LAEFIPIILVLPLIFIFKRFKKHPALVYISAALTIYFIVYAFLEPEDMRFYILFAFIGIVSTVRYAKSSGLLK